MTWYINYFALRDLAVAHHVAGVSGAFWPACLDAASLIAALHAWHSRRAGRSDPYAVSLMLFWAVAIVVGNAAAAWPDPVGMVIHGMPGLTLICVGHLLVRKLPVPEVVDPPQDVKSTSTSKPAASRITKGRPLRVVRGR